MKLRLAVIGGAFTLAMAALCPAAAHAVCVCGYGDGRFTTDLALAMDGNVGDWMAILTDTDNNVCDGATDNAGNVYPPQPDRDAPVQSTGRDLLHFAYSWDATNVYTYTERAASLNNTQNFIYYADTDNDSLMETGERVITASWQGSNRLVNLYLGSYVAAAAGGDPLANAQGFADGYRMPGAAIGFPPSGKPNYSGNWGSADGLKMEWSIPWTDLGITARAAFTFHVSSTNSTPGTGSFPAQVDDNMGGCGGGPASTQYADLTFTPDRTIPGTPGATVYAAHLLVNTGNGSDTFDLTVVAAGGFIPTASFYRDTDGNGTLTAGDSLLADSDGDGMPDTGPIPAGGSVNLLIAYILPSPAAGTAAGVTTATSSYDPNRSAAVTDTINVEGPDLSIVKAVTTFSDPVNLTAGPFAIPGAEMLYTLTVINSGTAATDSNSVVITDPLDPKTALVVTGTPFAFIDGTPSSGLTFTYGGLADPGDDVEFFSAADGWNHVPVADGEGVDPAITQLRLNPKGALAAPAGTGNPGFEIRFKVRIR